MNEKKTITYSEAFKLNVVSEIEAGKHSGPYAAAQAYAIGGAATVQRWLRQYGRQDLLPRKVLMTTMEELVGLYVSTRDKIKAIEAEHKEQLAPYRQGLDDVERLIPCDFDESGILVAALLRVGPLHRGSHAVGIVRLLDQPVGLHAGPPVGRMQADAVEVRPDAARDAGQFRLFDHFELELRVTLFLKFHG